MAAATTQSDHMTDKSRPIDVPAGASFDYITYSLATTEIDDDGDRVELIPIPAGATVFLLGFEADDLDDGATLDMDIVLTDDDGDTILHNAGAGFQTATSLTWELVDAQVKVQDADRVGNVGLLVNTAAGTPAAGDITVLVAYQ